MPRKHEVLGVPDHFEAFTLSHSVETSAYFAFKLMG